jgi:hypothetical protein
MFNSKWKKFFFFAVYNLSCLINFTNNLVRWKTFHFFSNLNWTCSFFTSSESTQSHCMSRFHDQYLECFNIKERNYVLYLSFTSPTSSFSLRIRPSLNQFLIALIIIIYCRNNKKKFFFFFLFFLLKNFINNKSNTIFFCSLVLFQNFQYLYRRPLSSKHMLYYC